MSTIRDEILAISNGTAQKLISENMLGEREHLDTTLIKKHPSAGGIQTKSSGPRGTLQNVPKAGGRATAISRVASNAVLVATIAKQYVKLMLRTINKRNNNNEQK